MADRDDSSEGSSTSVKVKDSRRVDSEGKLRNTQSTDFESKAQKTEASQAQGSSFTAEESAQDFSETDLTEFSRFVMSLAHQAIMYMGEVPAPPGVNIPVDKGAAKQMIDIIAMLREKTKGNLDATEQAFMKEVLHSLQITFVRISSSK